MSSGDTREKKMWQKLLGQRALRGKYVSEGRKGQRAAGRAGKLITGTREGAWREHRVVSVSPGTGGPAAPSVPAPRVRCWHLREGWAGEVTQEPGVLTGQLGMNL